MTDALLKLAAHAPFRAPMTEEEVLSDSYDKKIKARLELEYNQALISILEEDDRLVSMYANNAMKMAWNTTREYYLKKARLEAEWAETDRQTDKFEGCAIENI